jgi:hypothetical protein
MEHATDAVSAVDASPEDHEILGVIALTIFWRELLKRYSVERSQCIIVVIGSDGSCNQTLTYQLFSPQGKYLGRGDLHDPDYDNMTKFSYLHNLGKYSLRGCSYTGFPLSTDLCPYWSNSMPLTI